MIAIFIKQLQIQQDTELDIINELPTLNQNSIFILGMSRSSIDTQGLQKSNSSHSRDSIAEASKQSVQIIKINSDYFTELIREQKETRNLIEDMKKQIESLKSRVRKCQKSIPKKNRFQSQQLNIEKQPNFIYLNGKNIEEDNIRKQIRKHIKKASKQNQNLFITFGQQSDKRIEQQRSPIGKKYATSNSQEFANAIYYNKQSKKNGESHSKNKKSHCTHKKKRESTQRSSISSDSRNKQLTRLRKDFQKVSNDSKQTRKYKDTRLLTTQSNTSILNQNSKSLSKRIVKKMKELEALKGMYFKNK